MRKRAQRVAAVALGTALIALCAAPAEAQSVAVKPYFMVITDNSGSMTNSTGGGNNSCGQPHNRMSDAKCVLQNVVNGYGDAVFGLTRFTRSCSGSCSSSSCSATCGCTGCGQTCNSTAASGQVLVPIVDENQADIIEWVDYTCATCGTATGSQPELNAERNTPLTGSLRAVRQYYEGGHATFSSPIAGDPYEGCRPYYVILLTDGAETCGGNPATAATELRTTTHMGTTYDIRTFVIGFGISAGNAQIEAIATAGGTDAPGPNRGFYAADETQLALAFSQIMADSILLEVCNGVDDDCDTLIDEGFPLYCDWDGTGMMPTPTLCAPPPETLCDGLDNNCDGAVDEGLTNPCGVCGATPAEVCDGIDNDCDGIIDEGGVCGSCVPSAEICDGIDNDCDGPIDEGLSRTCGTGVGECTTGTQTCAAGVWGTCSGTGPTAELCDNLDNDCDGVTDGITRPCGSDVGECQAGLQLCTAGPPWGACIGAIGPVTEICDGLDNDCDGATDEGDPGGGGMCGSSIGACTPGTLHCLGGALTCTGGSSGGPETCNGVDDDCDGAVDEGVPSTGPCGSAVGECSEGALQCVGGAFTCVGGRGPVTEVCDGRDNDCDGSTDEGNPGGGVACGTDTGECEAGTSVCTGGSLICTGETGPVPEVCDALDNDCDGLVDEGNPGGGAPCGATAVGECELGALACAGGSLICVGETGPEAELCDGLDNDCDGMVDEGNPEGGAACGDATGECTPGTRLCVGGSLTCDGAVGPTPEVCNALDDDCDGVVDDGIPVGAPCGTDIGECSPGRNVCRAGALVCEGAIEPIPEVCDTLDNDCDGMVDEGLGLGAACGTDEGLCMAGMMQCVDGREICVGEVTPSRELCDCDDNDCDGTVDEPPDTGDLCPPGSSCVDCQCALPCTASEFGFTCPTGRAPAVQDDGSCFCVEEACNDTTCATETVERDGSALCTPDSTDVSECVCKNNECTFPCDGVVCGDGLVCNPRDRAGRCVDDGCSSLGCPSGEVCNRVSGECEADPCATTTCAADEACRGGTCEPSCATVACGTGELCEHGLCVDDPCAAAACSTGEICNPADGSCVDDPCAGMPCPGLDVCDSTTGECGADPCDALTCPEDQICVNGECAIDVPETPDAGVDSGPGAMDAGPDRAEGHRILATGGGGCVCAVPGRSTPGGRPPLGGLALLSALVGVLTWRRRR